jgi:hypothetical protein
MASVSIAARSGAVVGFSLVLAVAGALLTLNGFFSFAHLPLIPGGH